MMKKFLFSCVFACALSLVSGPSAGAAEVTADDVKPALEQLLKQHPEILLDFLREHSETVLDIAQQGSNKRRMANMEKQWKSDAQEPKQVALEGRPTLGNSDAKVRIVAFSDLTCLYCQRAEKVLAEILQEYQGKVSFVFKNLPLEPKGLSGLASQYYVAISMQNESLGWKFYETMFQNRDKLLSGGEEYMRAAAQEMGVNMKQMDSARRSKKVQKIIDEDIKDGEKLHIEGTPFFLINNLVIRGAVPKDIFRRAIEIELNAAR